MTLRDCLVDLADAAALAARDGFSTGLGIGHKFLEPAAPPRNRCDQQRAIFGADGSTSVAPLSGTSTSRRRVDGFLRHGSFSKPRIRR